jgi:hypothetical protein
MIISDVLSLKVSFYCVSASEFLVLIDSIPGVMVSEEENSGITRSSANLPLRYLQNIATPWPSDEWDAEKFVNTRKCNFVYAHQKSMAFCTLILTKQLYEICGLLGYYTSSCGKK